MHRIVGPPLRHVAAYTVRAGCVCSGWDRPFQHSRMAIAANGKSVAHSFRAVERQPEIPQRLSGHVGERPAIQPPDGMRQSGSGGLEMALHADLQFAVGTQTLGIHNGRTNLPGLRACSGGHLDMPLSRPMASLAIDPLGYRLQEFCPRTNILVAPRNLRVCVMAEVTRRVEPGNPAGRIPATWPNSRPSPHTSRAVIAVAYSGSSGEDRIVHDCPNP